MTELIAFLVANQAWLLPVAGAAGTVALSAAHARGYQIPVLTQLFNWVHNTYPSIPPSAVPALPSPVNPAVPAPAASGHPLIDMLRSMIPLILHPATTANPV